MSIESIVRGEFEQVAREQEKVLTGLSNDTVLLDSGLDSLCFAIIVARLEDRLGDFGGLTRDTALHAGYYVDPDTEEAVEDLSRRYTVALPRKSIARLRGVPIAVIHCVAGS